MYICMFLLKHLLFAVLNILLPDSINFVIDKCIKFVCIQIPEARLEVMLYSQMNNPTIVIKLKHQII